MLDYTEITQFRIDYDTHGPRCHAACNGRRGNCRPASRAPALRLPGFHPPRFVDAPYLRHTGCPALRSRPCRNLAVTRGQFATVGLGPRRCFASALPCLVLQPRQKHSPLASCIRSAWFPSGSAAASPLRHSACNCPMACGSQAATVSVPTSGAPSPPWSNCNQTARQVT